MAFEDALSLADTLASLATKDSAPRDRLEQWQAARQARVKKILDFTSRGGDMRKHSVSTFQRIIKEWAMWAYFLWVGEDAGLSWIYEYDTGKVAVA